MAVEFCSNVILEFIFNRPLLCSLTIYMRS
jgi:hypothetical protein